jgi:hypothetical protein
VAFKKGAKAGSKKTGRRGRKATPAQAEKAVRDALKAQGIKGKPSPDALRKIQDRIKKQGSGKDDGDHFRDA